MNWSELIESDILQNKKIWIFIAVVISGTIGYFMDRSESKKNEEGRIKFEDDMKIMFEESNKKMKEVYEESENEMKNTFNQCNILEDVTENTIYYKMPNSNEISFIEPEDISENELKEFYDNFELVSKKDFKTWLNS